MFLLQTIIDNLEALAVVIVGVIAVVDHLNDKNG